MNNQCTAATRYRPNFTGIFFFLFIHCLSFAFFFTNALESFQPVPQLSELDRYEGRILSIKKITYPKNQGYCTIELENNGKIDIINTHCSDNFFNKTNFIGANAKFLLKKSYHGKYDKIFSFVSDEKLIINFHEQISNIIKNKSRQYLAYNILLFYYLFLLLLSLVSKKTFYRYFMFNFLLKNVNINKKYILYTKDTSQEFNILHFVVHLAILLSTLAPATIIIFLPFYVVFIYFILKEENKIFIKNDIISIIAKNKNGKTVKYTLFSQIDHIENHWSKGGLFINLHLLNNEILPIHASGYFAGESLLPAIKQRIESSSQFH